MLISESRHIFWGKVLDKLMNALKIDSDAALARHFGVSRQLIHQMRNITPHRNQSVLPTKAMLEAILNTTDQGVTKDLLLALLPDDLANELRAFDKIEDR